MNVFDDVELKWGDKTYTVPANRMMGLIARVEEIVTLSELRGYGIRQSAPIAKLSMAYAAILRYAGLNISDEEVYAKMFTDDAADLTIMNAVRTVTLLMIPPKLRKQIESGTLVDKKVVEGNVQATTPPEASSRTLTD